MSANSQGPTRRTLRLMLATAALISSGALADIPGYPPSVLAYDPREVAMLPEYCKHSQLFRDAVPGGNDAQQIKRWTAIMGDMFIHIHHYCWGLMKTNRALILSRSREDRQRYLADSVSEFDYVIGHVKGDFVLLPEVLTRRGENLMRLGKPTEAVQDLNRAIELKRDYWPPYSALVELYRTSGDLAKAREIVKEGLANSPDARALQRQLAELSGAKAATDPSSGAARAKP